MSKHRGGKGDFAEHPAKARDEVKKGAKKAAVISPTITMFLSMRDRTAEENSALPAPHHPGKGVPPPYRPIFLSASAPR